jgi:SAM-dependent methyltransferase
VTSQRADPWFEDMYARAANDLERIPWARLAPRPELIRWLDRHPPASGTPALVVACGLGDDAEELARRGCQVEAFDLSPSAIATARRRFPASTVRYRVADLFALPADWAGRFAIAVEVLTVQSLPPEAHQDAIAAVTRCVAPGGHLLVRTAVRADNEPSPTRPWPLRHAELRWFEADGLAEVARCASEDGVFLHLAFRRSEVADETATRARRS